jgi:radical SAM protein with 4Fe4S-binding SPASM domain
MKKFLVSSLSLPDFPLWQKLKAKRAPLSFELEITARCNNNCRHCYINLPAGDQKAKARELSLEEFIEIAREAVALGAVWCLLTGGEPLIREDFLDLYLGLKRLGLLVSVFTNACLITQEHVALFKKFPPRDIEVTVYGVTSTTYENVTRQRGSFIDFRHGLGLLLASGVKIRLKTMAMRANVHELPEIAHFCKQHSKDYFRFDPFLHLRYDGNTRRNEEIRAQRLSPEEIVTLEQADPERWPALKKECAELATPQPSRACNHPFQCSAGLGNFVVSYDGLFRLCSSLWHPECVYNLKGGNLKEACEKFVFRVRRRRSLNQEFLEKCHACQIFNLCFWCPAHAHLETGQLDAWVEYFCQATHTRVQAVED